MASTALYVPWHPPRGPGPVPVWRGFVGERSRSAVHGWSQRAFRLEHMTRKVLGFTVQIPLKPEAVQQVMHGEQANYAKPDVVKKLGMALIGRGLLTSDGALWRDQRRIVAATFAPSAVDPLVGAFTRAARDTAADWEAGVVSDVAEAATDTTMRIIADTLFSGDPRLKTRAAMGHIAAALASSAETRFFALLGVPVIPYSRVIRAGQRGQAYLRTTLADVVRERIARGAAEEDFLDTLVRQLTDKFGPAEALGLAVDNACTFYLAGHETTANALAWTLYLLAEQPEWQELVAAEAREALAAGDADEGLPERLPILRRVLEEALRLYPPVPRFDRQAVADAELAGVPVGKGDIVSIWPWLLHRHEALWDQPDAFDPDRFLPDRRGSIHRFQYIPFGGGPRVCVGMRFALAEALSVLAAWLAEWRFVSTGAEVRPTGMVTLRPNGGVKLVVEGR